MHISFSLAVFEGEISVSCNRVMESVFRLTVWLHKDPGVLISKKASFLSRTSRNVLYMYQQEKNKQTNKQEISNFLLKA